LLTPAVQLLPLHISLSISSSLPITAHDIPAALPRCVISLLLLKQQHLLQQLMLLLLLQCWDWHSPATTTTGILQPKSSLLQHCLCLLLLLLLMPVLLLQHCVRYRSATTTGPILQPASNLLQQCQRLLLLLLLLLLLHSPAASLHIDSSRYYYSNAAWHGNLYGNV
jgi:hypothetical protein